MNKSLAEQTQLQQVLEVAAKSDARNEALVQEMRVANKSADAELNTQKELLREELCKVKQQQAELSEARLACEGSQDQAQYKVKQAEAKLKQTQEFLQEKEAEAGACSHELQQVKQQLSKLQLSHASLAASSESDAQELTRKLASAFAQLEQAQESGKAKQIQLEDQLTQITQLKQHLAQAKEELHEADS